MSPHPITSTGTPVAARRPGRRVLFASGIGNFIEWYDFVVYGSLATTLAVVFFPGRDPVLSLLITFATFGVAFAMRPVGGVVFGHLGDRLGRRTTLVTIVAMTSGATFGIGLLPSYATIGLLAPVLLVLLRCVQGFGAGGEMASAATYVLEHAPANRRATYASSTGATAVLGLAAGGATVLLLSVVLSPADLTSWGWRLPFLAGGPLGVIALYIRTKLDETASFVEAKRSATTARLPVVDVLRFHRRNLFVVFVFVVAHANGIYFLGVFLVSHMITAHHTGLTLAQATNLVALLLAVGVAFAAGRLADSLGRRPVVLAGLVTYVVLGVPSFLLMDSGGTVAFLLAQCGLAVAVGFTSGMVTVIQVELFPPAVRVSGASLSYNLAQMVGGGTAPLVAGWLVHTTGSLLVAYLYVMALALLAATVVTRMFREPHVDGSNAPADQ